MLEFPAVFEAVKALGAGFTFGLVVFVYGLHRCWWYMASSYEACNNLSDAWEERAKAAEAALDTEIGRRLKQLRERPP